MVLAQIRTTSPMWLDLPPSHHRGSFIPLPAVKTSSTFEDAFRCGRESFNPAFCSDQQIVLLLLRDVRELEVLREDERVMGRIPLVADGYAWVLGHLAGIMAAYAAGKAGGV